MDEGQQEQGAADSQQTPDQDSALQTPQPDQPHPDESGQTQEQPPADNGQTQESESAPEPDSGSGDGDSGGSSNSGELEHSAVDNSTTPAFGTQYRPRHIPPAARDSDQDREDMRQAELDEERDSHNKRTGDGSLKNNNRV